MMGPLAANTHSTSHITGAVPGMPSRINGTSIAPPSATPTRITQLKNKIGPNATELVRQAARGKPELPFLVVASRIQDAAAHTPLLNLSQTDDLVADLRKLRSAAAVVRRWEIQNRKTGYTADQIAQKWLSALKHRKISHEMFPTQWVTTADRESQSKAGFDSALNRVVFDHFWKKILATEGLGKPLSLVQAAPDVFLKYLLGKGISLKTDNLFQNFLQFDHMPQEALLQFQSSIKTFLTKNEIAIPNLKIPPTFIGEGNRVLLYKMGVQWIVASCSEKMREAGITLGMPEAAAKAAAIKANLTDVRFDKINEKTHNLEQFISRLIIGLWRGIPTMVNDKFIQPQLNALAAKLNSSFIGQCVLFVAKVSWFLLWPVRKATNAIFRQLTKSLPTVESLAHKLAHNIVTLLHMTPALKLLLVRAVERSVGNMTANVPAAPGLTSRNEQLGHLLLAFGQVLLQNIFTKDVMQDIQKIQNNNLVRYSASLALRVVNWKTTQSVINWAVTDRAKAPGAPVSKVQQAVQTVFEMTTALNTANTNVKAAHQIYMAARKAAVAWGYMDPANAALENANHNWENLIHETALDLGTTMLRKQRSELEKSFHEIRAACDTKKNEITTSEQLYAFRKNQLKQAEIDYRDLESRLARNQTVRDALESPQGLKGCALEISEKIAALAEQMDTPPPPSNGLLPAVAQVFTRFLPTAPSRTNEIRVLKNKKKQIKSAIQQFEAFPHHENLRQLPAQLTRIQKRIQEKRQELVDLQLSSLRTQASLELCDVRAQVESAGCYDMIVNIANKLIP